MPETNPPPLSNKLPAIYNKAQHVVARTLFCCPEFAQTSFREMDLEDWKIHAVRAWEIAGVFVKESRKHRGA